MADPISQIPLMKEGLIAAAESPPSYNESEMASHQNQYSFNQPPNFPHQHPQTVPTMSAPPVDIQGPQLSSTVTAVNLAMPSAPVPVGPKPMQMRCFHCQAFITTKTNSSAKSSAHFACCLLFLFTCGICSCIPYCMGSCRKVDHSCPNCKSFLGTYNA